MLNLRCSECGGGIPAQDSEATVYGDRAEINEDCVVKCESCNISFRAGSFLRIIPVDTGGVKFGKGNTTIHGDVAGRNMFKSG